MKEKPQHIPDIVPESRIYKELSKLNNKEMTQHKNKQKMWTDTSLRNIYR